MVFSNRWPCHAIVANKHAACDVMMAGIAEILPTQTRVWQVYQQWGVGDEGYPRHTLIMLMPGLTYLGEPH